MAGFEVLIVILPLAAAAHWVGERIKVPYPILLVGAGMLLSVAPWVNGPDLSPNVVFVVFLPPLLYYAAYFISRPDLRANVRHIRLLAVGLVVYTMAAVTGVLIVLLPGIPLAVAAAAGAVVAPTDPVAATSVFRRSNAPERLVTIVEGEGLVNDGAALVFYGTAVTAAAAGSLQMTTVAWDLLVAPTGGVVLGLALAWISVAVRRRVSEPLVEVTLSLAAPYLAYLVADSIGVSGILATVAAGLFVGSRTGSIYAATSRLQAYAFLDVLVFMLNSVLFTLVGMEIVRVVHDVPGIPALRVAAVSIAVVAAVVGVRLAFMLIGPVAAQARRSANRLARRERMVVGWSGMRGGVSLAAAPALPLKLSDGSPFPYRDLVILITAAVIVGTLVVQGTTLLWLTRRLGVGREGHGDQERRARLLATRAALDWLEERATEGTAEDAVVPLQALYTSRLHRLQDHQPETDDDADAYGTLHLETVATERAAVMALYDEGRISAEVLRHIEHGLDLEESRLVDP